MNGTSKKSGRIASRKRVALLVRDDVHALGGVHGVAVIGVREELQAGAVVERVEVIAGVGEDRQLALVPDQRRRYLPSTWRKARNPEIRASLACQNWNSGVCGLYLPGAAAGWTSNLAMSPGG